MTSQLSFLIIRCKHCNYLCLKFSTIIFHVRYLWTAQTLYTTCRWKAWPYHLHILLLYLSTPLISNSFINITILSSITITIIWPWCTGDWLSQPRPGVSGSGVYKILYILIKGPANTIHLPLAANTDAGGKQSHLLKRARNSISSRLSLCRFVCVHFFMKVVTRYLIICLVEYDKMRHSALEIIPPKVAIMIVLDIVNEQR